MFPRETIGASKQLCTKSLISQFATYKVKDFLVLKLSRAPKASLALILSLNGVDLRDALAVALFGEFRR